MNQYLLFAILGLGAGALFASLAQGIVLTHRGSGVIDLSAGAMAMYVAYTYAGLRNGELMIPPLPNPFALIEGVAGWFGSSLRLPRWPTFIHLHGPMSTAWAMVVAAAIGVLMGLLAHLLVYRPLRQAPPLAKTIASVGVLLTLQAIVVLRFGTENVAVQPNLPSGSVALGHSHVPENRFILAGIAIAIAIALTALFRYTRLGLATRAASENELGAILLGLSPSRLAAVNWMLSALIAGVVGILFASITGLNPTDYVLFVIPALGAALVAGLESFWLAALIGLLIGCAESVTVVLQSNFSWFPKAGAATGIPFIVIIIAMIIRGKSLPTRGTFRKVSLPAAPEPKHVLRFGIVLSVLTLIGLIWFPFDLRGALDNTLIGAIISLSYVVIVGFAGQVSLMQVSLAGVSALLMTRFAGDMGIPFPVSPILAVVVACLVGVIAGLPALRVRGVHLAVLTLGAAYVFENMVLQNESLLRPTDTSASVPPPHIGSFNFGVNSSFPFGSPGSPSAWFGIFLLVATLVCFAAVIRLRRSDLGRQFLAVRSNERAAAGLGIHIPTIKLIAFGAAAALAGVAGVLQAYQFQGVTASPYIAMASVSALAFAYLGGISTVSGAIFAGVLATGGLAFRLLERVAHLGQYELLIGGLGLILTAVLNPEGIAGAMRQTARSVSDRIRRHSGRSVGGGAAQARPAPARERSAEPAAAVSVPTRT
jgi:ABC-type branched-subunit amino acid transport system permease subunit